MSSPWRGFLALACLVVCGPAAAAGFDVVAGPSVTSSQRVTGAIFASVYGESPADGRRHVEPVGTFGWVAARDTRNDGLDHNVFLAGGGIRLVTASRHWFLSEQLAATSGRTGALSTRLEFMTSAGWQGGRVIVMLRHVSNANLFGRGANLGETMLLAGVRW